MNKNGNFKAVLGTLVAFLLCTIMFTALYYNSSENFGIQEATYLQFKEMANNGEIESASISKDETTFEFVTKDGKTYVTENPDYDSFKFDMMEHGIQVEEIQPINTSSLFSILINAVFIGIMIYFLSSMMKQQNGGIGKKLIKPEKDEKEEVNINIDGKKKVNKRRTSFQDVAGLKQVKDDMKLLVDFLKSPNQYLEAGAKLPKGVIFYGPPGTGKTLLAKALAGEAGVPFFNMSGSDFIEMFVGMGAKRVRELFEEARKNAPCIIFIDELDAIGNSRSNLSSGATEHRQTINALLAEMDGFNGAEGILVIGATNRLEDLDTALIRPGRFDKHIAIPLPETADERMECIKMYAANKKFAEDVDFDVLAKETIGFSPADIEALLNEAVLISVQENKKFVDKKCIDEAVYKKLLQGHAKEDAKRNKDEIELVAWHEAGHALIGKLCNMDVSKVTIIPSTSGTGGVNIIIPKKMGLYSIEELKNNVKMSYGGRCAEYLLYGDWNKTTTGASADIKQATSTIYNMISMYGMTEEYGMLNLNELNIDNKEILQKAVQMSKELMEETLEMLKQNRDMHQAIVNVLLEKETISGKELDEIYNKYKKDSKNEKVNVSLEKEDRLKIVGEVENEKVLDKMLSMLTVTSKTTEEENVSDITLDDDSERKDEDLNLTVIKESNDISDSENVTETSEIISENIINSEKSKETVVQSEEVLELQETEEIPLEDDATTKDEITVDTLLTEKVSNKLSSENVMIEISDIENQTEISEMIPIVENDENLFIPEIENSDFTYAEEIPEDTKDIHTEEVYSEELYNDNQPTISEKESEVTVATVDNGNNEVVIEIATPTLNKSRNRRRKKKKH